MKKMLIDAPDTCGDCWLCHKRNLDGLLVCLLYRAKVVSLNERPETCRALDVDVSALKVCGNCAVWNCYTSCYIDRFATCEKWRART